MKWDKTWRCGGVECSPWYLEGIPEGSPSVEDPKKLLLGRVDGLNEMKDFLGKCI